MDHEQRRLKVATAAQALIVADDMPIEVLRARREEVMDGIRALQSTDTPGTEALERNLWQKLSELEALIQKAPHGS